MNDGEISQVVAPRYDDDTDNDFIAPPALVEDKKNTLANSDASTKSDQNVPAKNSILQAIPQCLANLPQELLSQKRFFPVRITKTNKKVPCIKEWQEPKNQMTATEAIKKTGLIGMDICGHGIGADYFFVDFDHVTNESGNFIYPEAEKWDNYLRLAETFREHSISKNGTHYLLNPTSNKFPKLTGENAGHAIYFDASKKGKHSPKIELFYCQGRYILLTGDCEPNMKIVSGAVADEFCQQLVNQVSFDTSQIKDTIDTAINPADISIEEVNKMLSVISCVKASYADWWKIGAIIHYHFRAKGFELWRAWSETDKARYTLEVCQKVWRTLDERTKLNIGKPATIGSLIFFAKKFGYKPQKILTQVRADFDSQAQINFSHGLNAEQKEFLFAGDSSDLDNARRIKFFTGDIIKYSISSSEWFYFEKNGVWKNHGQEIAVIKNHALKLADLMFTAAKGDKNETALAKNLKKNKTINSAIDILKALDEVFITEKDLDNHPTLLNCLNGVVDLQTGKLYPAKPKLLLTQQAGGNFRGLDFHSPIVNKFLQEILPDPDTLQTLLRYLGYSLTGLIRDHKALFVFGSGRNGKGTLTRLLLATFGDYATELPKSAVLKADRSKEAGAPSPELMVLKKKRLAIVEEISDPDYRLDSTKIKNLAGGDRVAARALHKNYESGGGFDPTHKLLLSGNKLPRLDDVRDIGLIERLLNVPFEQKFLQPDTHLSEKLAAQLAIDAMLSILVKNAVEYLRSGLLESKKTTEAKQNYLDNNDWLAEFFSEYCVFVPSAETKRKELLDLLREKCIKQTAPYNKSELADMILNATKSHGVHLKLDNHKNNVFRGIGIRGDI